MILRKQGLKKTTPHINSHSIYPLLIPKDGQRIALEFLVVAAEPAEVGSRGLTASPFAPPPVCSDCLTEIFETISISALPPSPAAARHREAPSVATVARCWALRRRDYSQPSADPLQCASETFLFLQFDAGWHWMRIASPD